MKYYLMTLFVLPYKPVTWWMYDYTCFKSTWMILLKSNSQLFNSFFLPFRYL